MGQNSELQIKIIIIQNYSPYTFYLYFYLIERPHIFMMRIKEDILYTKIKWFDPYMRGDFVQSEEITFKEKT